MKVQMAWLRARSSQFGITLRGSSRRNPPASRSSGSSLHGAPAAHAPSDKATVSAPRCVGCKRVIRIAGIHKIGTRGAQQFFDLLDRLPNHAAGLAGLNLAF